jgi:molybdenum cofactor biosynthesis enzyme
MHATLTYRFEGISSDLPTPPIAARRAMGALGILLVPSGWSGLAVEVRRALAVEGCRDVLDRAAIKDLTRRAHVRDIKLVQAPEEPNITGIPSDLLKALGPHFRMTLPEWQSIGGLARYTLATLSYNRRLLARAVDELLPRRGRLLPEGARVPWVFALGHCEVVTRVDVLERVLRDEAGPGRGLELARTAGLRAARRVTETFDRLADRATGPVELDWGVRAGSKEILWQSHVSTWDGAFCPTSSLVAATTAAVALLDVVWTFDPRAAIYSAGVFEEEWTVGRERLEEDATRFQ